MNRLISSWMTKLFALICGYAAAFSIVRDLSQSFDYYVGKSPFYFLKMEMILAVPLFVACTAFLFLSVWKSEKMPTPLWRNIDFSLLAILSFCATCLCAYYTRFRIINNSSIRFFVMPIVAYAIVMAMLAETTARLRDRCMVFYWSRFFKSYPLRRPVGLLMALYVVGSLAYLIFIYPTGLMRGYLNLPLFLLCIFTISALTYLCTFLLSLSAEYDKANAEKIRAERFKAELITNVSHDIRTPLTSIVNYVDLLKALPVEHPDFMEYVGILDKKAARLKTLIGDLMEASKASTGNVNVALREIDLCEIVGQIAGEFDEQFTERGLTLVLRQPDQALTANADSGHLWRVLENLFGNAVKYALPGTRVFVEIDVCDGNPAIFLKNTSLTPIDQSGDTLTEQFMRGDRARQTDGSGLGLYIAKSLVELMGGRFVIQVSGDLFEVKIVFG